MPQGEYPRIASKDEILRMYDRVMMNYQSYLLKHMTSETHENEIIFSSTMKEYAGKIEVLRNILGFNGNMEDE